MALAAAAAAAAAARRAALGRTAEVLVEDRRDGLLRGLQFGVHPLLPGRASRERPGTMVRAVAREDYKDGVRGTIA